MMMGAGAGCPLSATSCWYFLLCTCACGGARAFVVC
jgi:hypothetical protein